MHKMILKGYKRRDEKKFSDTVNKTWKFEKYTSPPTAKKWLFYI